MNLVLIDTSVWIAILRPSPDEKLVKKVRRLMEDGEAAWCPMVQLELWSGVKDAKERKQLRDFNSVLQEIEITPAVWHQAFQIGGIARSKGITAPATDQLIYACAKVHGAEVLHLDKHFDLLAQL